MPKKIQTLKETTMYSVNHETGVIVTHHLPWTREDPQLEHYVRKGFTYERPLEEETEPTVAELDAARKVLDNAPVKSTMLAVTDEKGTHILEKKQRRKYHKKVKKV